MTRCQKCGAVLARPQKQDAARQENMLDRVWRWAHETDRESEELKERHS